MPLSEQDKSFFSKKAVILTATIISGFSWYLSSGLSGDYWWLFWLAPIPVLITSLRVSGKKAFLISFIAYLIGRLSWFSYLVKIATVVPAIIFTVVFSLVFSLVIIIARRIVIESNSWYSVFAFPVFFTTFEFLLITFSPHGTAGSIGYSQSNFLPVIQIASITGILGITFLVTFIPSAIATAWYYRKEKINFQYTVSVGVIIVSLVFLFGIIRVKDATGKNTIKAGLLVLDEKLYNVTDHPDFQKEKLVAEYYAKEISSLAAQGAQLILLPERAINIGKETGDSIISILTNAAKQNHVFIVTGYTNFRNERERNSTLVIDAEGNPITDYNKVYLIPGLEHQFAPGREPGLFTVNEAQAGIAICKDLDFPGYIKKYGRSGVSFLSVPAWDFVTDDWLHSRMAILRGVENGFSEIRTARLGRLTISDCYGRVTYEANSSNGQRTTLLGEVSLLRKTTIYTRFGDWFGLVNLIAAAGFIFLGIKKVSTKKKV